MIKIFIGGKGSGKTKTLIELTNAAAQTSNGSVVCIEKGDKLKHEITYKARLIDTDEYSISTATGLYGFIAGVIITLVPMVVGYIFARKICKLPLLNTLGSITGGMTSTPALGTLIAVAETDDVAGAYASTYPIALVLIVFACQIIGIIV